MNRLFWFVPILIAMLAGAGLRDAIETSRLQQQIAVLWPPIPPPPPPPPPPAYPEAL